MHEGMPGSKVTEAGKEEVKVKLYESFKAFYAAADLKEADAKLAAGVPDEQLIAERAKHSAGSLEIMTQAMDAGISDAEINEIAFKAHGDIAREYRQ